MELLLQKLLLILKSFLQVVLIWCYQAWRLQLRFKLLFLIMFLTVVKTPTVMTLLNVHLLQRLHYTLATLARKCYIFTVASSSSLLLPQPCIVWTSSSLQLLHKSIFLPSGGKEQSTQRRQESKKIKFIWWYDDALVS